MKTAYYEGDHHPAVQEAEPDGAGVRVTIVCTCGNSFTSTGEGHPEDVAAHALAQFETVPHGTPVRRPEAETDEQPAKP